MHYQSIFRNDLFKEQIFVVTGGGSGIGRCIAHELASLGAGVVITGRHKGAASKGCNNGFAVLMDYFSFKDLAPSSTLIFRPSL